MPRSRRHRRDQNAHIGLEMLAGCLAKPRERKQQIIWGVRQNCSQAAAASVFRAVVPRSLDTSQAWLSCQGQTIVGGSLGVEPVLPELVQAPAAVDAAQCQNVFSSRLRPEHA